MDERCFLFAGGEALKTITACIPFLRFRFFLGYRTHGKQRLCLLILLLGEEQGCSCTIKLSSTPIPVCFQRAFTEWATKLLAENPLWSIKG
jgi:hypothetical protein